MRIILDQDIHFNPVPAELGLDADTAVDLLSSGMELGSEDCVILISAMANGFKADHKKLFMENPEVSRWIVVLVKQNYVISANNIINTLNALHAQGEVIPCPIYDAEALRAEIGKRLGQATINKKSCLVFSRSEGTDPAPLAALIGDLLPGWTIEVQTGENPPLDSGHGYIIIAGRKLPEFIELPEEIAPRAMLVLLQEPGNVQLSRNRNEMNRFIFYHSGLKWSEDAVCRRCFIINPLYERMRKLVREKPATVNSLRNDPAFIMWDRFGLPMSRKLYTGEAIGKFLNGFNECESLAARLKN